MFDLAVKNIIRHKLRSILTIIGIAIGVGMIVSLGSIGAGMNKLVQTIGEESAGTIMVVPEGGTMTSSFGGQLSESVVSEIENVGGVKRAVPEYGMLEISGFSSGFYVAGIPPEDSSLMAGEKIRLEEGRGLEEGDEEDRVVIIGGTFPGYDDIYIGDTIKIKNTEFEVIGKLEKASGGMGADAIAPIKTLQELDKTDKISMVLAIVDDVSKVQETADEIENSVSEVHASTSEEIARQFSDLVGQINTITLGIGAIAAIIGGIGIMNTMIMSVNERKREFGIMKAIGATNLMVLKQVIEESAFLSLLGAIVGLVFSVAGVSLMSSFVSIVSITPELVFIGTAFALVLGVSAGSYPAYKASKLNVVDVLKSE